MSAFKKFNRQDVYVTAYSAKKSWSASGSAISDYGIEVLRGISGSTPNYLNPNDLVSSRYETLTWQSINHLYYKGFVQESANSGSYEHYLQSSFTSGSRRISDEIALISLPRNVIGTHIEPGSFVLDAQASESDNYVLNDYLDDDDSGVIVLGDYSVSSFFADTSLHPYVEYIDNIYGSELYPEFTEDYLQNEGDYVLETDAAGGQFIETTTSNYRREILDDGNGRLFLSASRSTLGSETGIVVGDIIYTHGQAIITNPDIARYYNEYLRPIIKWKSNKPIYTYNFNCKVKDSELTHTLNPTARVGEDGKIADNVSGSYFNPYVTSVGLYNDSQELIAVAKLGLPVPKSTSTDMTFVVALDV